MPRTFILDYSIDIPYLCPPFDIMVRKKHIATLLLICFSVLIGHSIIPHRHHPELAVGQKCPLEHNDQRSSGEHSGHCHAFNGLAFFNAGIATVPKIHTSTPLVIEIQNLELIVPQRVINLHVPLKILDPSVVPDAFLSLRGPPSIA